jgi:hypothetical protein
MIVEPDYMADLVFDPQTHTYRVRGSLRPHITEIVPSDYSHVPPRNLERARLRGSAVHKATELYDLKTLDWCVKEIMGQPFLKLEPYLLAWIKAVNEYEIEFEPCDVERRLYHPIDLYTGTGDRPRAWIKPPNQRRRLATIEIKTIAKMDDAVGLQTAGQQRAENYRARVLGIPETVDRWGIQLRKDETFKAYHYNSRHHEQVFLSYLCTLNYEVSQGKRKYAIQNATRRVYA